MKSINDKQRDTIKEITKDVEQKAEKIKGLELNINNYVQKTMRLELELAAYKKKGVHSLNKINEQQEQIKFLENETKFFEGQFSFTKTQTQRDRLVFFEQSN